MSIVAAHAALLADLTDRLPDYDVLGVPRAEVPQERPRVFVLAREARAADVACPYSRLSCDVIIVTPRTDIETALGDVHAITDAVLAAVATCPHTSWESATFTDPFMDVNPAARVVVERNLP